MNANKIILVIPVLLCGCATTPKQRIIRDTLIAGAVGAYLGSQRSEHKNTYSAMYAGGAASIAAITSVIINDPDKEVLKIRAEKEQVQKELDDLISPKLEETRPGTLSAKLPQKYQSLVNPGEWRIYSIDQWIEDGENRLIHQDKIMELIPPTLKPAVIPKHK